MLRSRRPAVFRQSRQPAPELQPPLSPAADSIPSVGDLLRHSWAGRLFLASAAVRIVIALLRPLVGTPAPLAVVSTLASVGMVVSVGYFVWRLFVVMKRRLLWRVRRKLILSYIFIGVVPAMLIIAFFMLGALVVSANVSAYLFRDGYDDVVSHASLAATAAATEIARSPNAAPDTLARVQRGTSRTHDTLSMVFVPAIAGMAPVEAGDWAHGGAPDHVPGWISRLPEGTFAGTIVPGKDAAATLVVRAVTPVGSVRRIGHVVVDIPVDRALLDRLHDATGVRAGSIRVGAGTNGAPGTVMPGDGAAQGDPFALFGRGVTFLEAREWDTGEVHQTYIENTYSVRELYDKVAGVQTAQLGGMSFGQALLIVLAVVAALFLIIQFVALVMGLALARSITSSVHELFMGTERVRHGDFAHRISVRTRDQLGELAASFNQMVGSIENLLQTAAEKKRLEEELRIARQIQMSLLPRGTLDVPGLEVTALCVPAREVGGDYYDFFTLPDGQLGLLIADVSGKGTSAALYMAELKGLVLSLSQIYRSPRQLLIEVNRIISENLDSRSFITMTYAVLDLAAGTMTYARAGHTPLMYLQANSGDGGVRVLAPSGLVLGLRIPGAEQKFVELLEEDSLSLAEGDVIVLYTDGITEAMNTDSDLFGEGRLGRLIEEHRHLDSAELRERILREIEAFVGPADQHDDMTMILIKIERLAAARGPVDAGVHQVAGSPA